MLFTDAEKAQLLKNGRASQDSPEGIDHEPVVKLFTPDAGAIWLLSELYPDDETIAFGLCDLGMGFPELGDVSLTELVSLRGKMGLPVERDRSFTVKKSLSEYANDARKERKIVT